MKLIPLPRLCGVALALLALFPRHVLAQATLDRPAGSRGAVAMGPAGPATAATNAVGLELFRQVASEHKGENVLLSPFSIQIALAMAYAGAEGETRAEMARVLHFPDDDASLAADFGQLSAAIDASVKKSVELARRAAQSPDNPSMVDPIEWHLANRLFGQSDYGFREPFLAFVRDSYSAPLELKDFKTAYDPARLAINAWVEEQTRQKIPDLIPPGGLDPTTRLVLVNALYLKAPWASEFRKDWTDSFPFQLRGTTPVNVPTMDQVATFGYAKRDGFTAVTLPYLGGDLQFLVLLPDDPAGLDALVARMTPETLRGCASLGRTRVDLSLPKFRLAGQSIKLGKTLQAMGMKTAFDLPHGSANFERMRPRRPGDYLKIAEVFHKTFIAVDEEGTEAAAATAVVMSRNGGRPAPPIVVQADHPFLFAIQLRESGACLFLGQLTDPR